MRLVALGFRGGDYWCCVCVGGSFGLFRAMIFVMGFFGDFIWVIKFFRGESLL